MDAEKRALLTADGSRVSLSSRPFQLLLFFVRHPGELLDKDRLMKAVWPETVVEENNLNQSIGAIRKALGESPGTTGSWSPSPGAATGSWRPYGWDRGGRDRHRRPHRHRASPLPLTRRWHLRRAVGRS